MREVFPVREKLGISRILPKVREFWASQGTFFIKIVVSVHIFLINKSTFEKKPCQLLVDIVKNIILDISMQF